MAWAEELEKRLSAQSERQQALLKKEGVMGLTLLRMQQSLASQQEAMKEMTAKFSGLLLQLTETREALSQTQRRAEWQTQRVELSSDPARSKDVKRQTQWFF